VKLTKAICLCATGAAISSACAQSEVTLYGRVNGGVQYLNKIPNGSGGTDHRYGFSSNDFGFSWWGVTGSEDLGDGLRAVFKLESPFVSGTGSQAVPDAFFARHSYVGLGHAKLGSLWLGRTMSLADETGWYIDPLAEQLIGVGNLAQGRAWGPRMNTITYNSPRWDGFSFKLQGAPGEVAGSTSGNRLLSAAAAYEREDIKVYGVIEDLRDANGKLSTLYNNSRFWMLGANYTLGDFKLYGGYQHIQSDEDATIADPTNPTAATRSDQAWVGASYTITPPLSVQAGLYHVKLNRDGGSATLAALNSNYYLSKRTILYATFGSVKNKGNAVFPAIVYQPGPPAGSSQQGTYIGMMHYF
jgi:predicted porin